MSFFKKIHRGFSKIGRKVGLGRTASNIWARSITGDAIGAARAAQRSHRLGHTWASSWSESNQLTKYYNKLMSKIGKSASRAVARNTNTNSASSVRTQTAMPAMTSQRLNYGYRRLSDIT